MKVKDVMTKEIVSVPSDASAAEAARKMKDNNVGTVLIIDGSEVKGLVTDRAIATKVVAEAKDPRQVPIDTIMTRNLITCNDDSDVIDAVKMMGDKKIRRCPVVNDRKELVGIMSVADVAQQMRPCMDSIFDELSKAAR